MIVFDSIEKIKEANSSEKYYSNAVFKGISFEGDDFLLLFEFIRGLDNIIISDCVFNKGNVLRSRASAYINSYKSLKIINSEFHHMDLDISQSVSNPNPSIQIINSNIMGDVGISGELDLLSIVNSRLKGVVLFTEPKNTFFVNSSLDRFDINESDFEITNENIICSNTTIEEVYLEDVAVIWGLGNKNSTSNVYHLLFYNDTEVSIGDTRFEVCDLADTVFDNITIESDLVFTDCNVTNMDLRNLNVESSAVHGSISLDFRNCKGFDSVALPELPDVEVERVSDNFLQIWIGCG